MGNKFKVSPPPEPPDAREVRWQDSVGGLTCAYRTETGMWDVGASWIGLPGEYTWDQLMERIGQKRWKTLRVIGPRGY